MNAICSVCHKPLWDPKSVAVGVGPVCRGGQSHGRRKWRSSQDQNEICKSDDFADEFDNSIPFRTALVMKRRGRDDDADTVRHTITNIPHLVVHHSPSGFEFGYGGSGPADLALNVCQLYLNITDYRGDTTKCFDGQCWTLAWRLHQEFKREFIERVRHNGETIPFAHIDAWFKRRITKDLLEQCDMQDMFEKGTRQ